jgi:hypothetical protein
MARIIAFVPKVVIERRKLEAVKPKRLTQVAEKQELRRAA